MINYCNFSFLSGLANNVGGKYIVNKRGRLAFESNCYLNCEGISPIDDDEDSDLLYSWTIFDKYVIENMGNFTHHLIVFPSINTINH